MSFTKSVALILIILFPFHSVRAATYYLDPINGNLSNDGSLEFPWPSFQEVIDANYIQSFSYSPLPYDPITSTLIPKNSNGFVESGDTLMLLSGLHGSAFLRNYINEAMITVMASPNEEAIIEFVKLQACKNWSFENISVSTEPYNYYLQHNLFFIESHGWQGPSSHINVESCKIYSTSEPWTEADDWINKSSKGLYILGDSITARNNQILNIDTGLTALGDFIIAENNQIINFSGDGMRILGSHILFKSNLIKNCYKVDDNHDDGIQSFTTTGLVVDNNQIIGNIIINSDNPDRPLNGPLQGIGCFDGFYNNWIIANNLIHVDHWHGITLLGANNCQIINNTVIDPTPDITPGASWIRIDNHKDGTPSLNCLVANNVTNKIVADATLANNIILDTYEQYQSNFMDYLVFDFHLKDSSVLIDAADLSFATMDDLEGNPRDNNPDIGAYEFYPASSDVNLDVEFNFSIFPNPSSDKICLSGELENKTIIIINNEGKTCIASKAEKEISVQHLLPNTYTLILLNKNQEIKSVKQLIVY